VLGYLARYTHVSPFNFYQLVESYQNHPEAKSLGQTGSQVSSTRVDCGSERTLSPPKSQSTSGKNPTAIGSKGLASLGRDKDFTQNLRSMHYERAPRFGRSKLDVAPPPLRCAV
jgi:hypothetical protein